MGLEKQLLNKLLGYGNYTITLYPVMTGVPAVGAVCTCGAGAWGAYVDVIAAAAITVDFFLLQIQYDTVDAIQDYEIQIYNATLTTTLYEDRIDCTSATTPNLNPTTLPFPIKCNANAQIQGRVGGAAAKVLGISLLTAIGL